MLSRAYPPDVVAGLGRLWSARGGLLDALDRVPVAAFHGDFQRRNLHARRSNDGWRTVAIDWANTGRAHLGVDPAVLLHQAQPVRSSWTSSSSYRRVGSCIAVEMRSRPAGFRRARMAANRRARSSSSTTDWRQ